MLKTRAKNGARMSAHSRTNQVGMGSSSDVLSGSLVPFYSETEFDLGLERFKCAWLGTGCKDRRASFVLLLEP